MFDPPVKYTSKDITYVFTINSERVKKYSPSVVGYCNNSKHKGFLTQSDIREHQCKEKECSCLMKLTHKHEYWDKYFAKQEKAEQKAEQKRQKIQRGKEIAENIRKKHSAFIERGNIWLREEKYSEFCEVAGVRYDKKTKTTIVTYVSDRRLDEFEFADIYTHFRMQVGGKTQLTRIKNQDKSFATLEEWHNSEKYKELMQERGEIDEKCSV